MATRTDSARKRSALKGRYNVRVRGEEFPHVVLASTAAAARAQFRRKHPRIPSRDIMVSAQKHLNPSRPAKKRSTAASRSAAAKKGAATRKRKAAARSRAAKKAAATRKRNARRASR